MKHLKKISSDFESTVSVPNLWLAQPGTPQLCLAFATMLLVGAVDHYLGEHLSFSIFYLLPISYVAWHYSEKVGLISAFVGVSIWSVADYEPGSEMEWVFATVWNPVARFGVFFLATRILSKLRGEYENREKVVQERTAELRAEILVRTQAEMRLEESSKKFRDLVENISDVYFVVDAKGNLVYGSPNLVELSKYSLEEIIGKFYLDFVADEDRDQMIAFHQKSIASGTQDTRYEFRLKAKNGTKIWVEQSTRFIREGDGSLKEYRNVLRDISERKNAEQSLRQAELRFENIFAENLDDLETTDAAQRLSASQPSEVGTLALRIDSLACKLQDSIRRAMTFSSLASHELRSPLALIRRQLEEALYQEKSRKPLRSILTSVYDEILTTNQTVEGLLTLSRLLTGKVSLKLEHVQLSDWLKEFYDEALLLSREKNMSVVLARVPNVTVNIDRQKMRQVFFNLLDNALKFTPRGGRIRINSEQQDGAVVIRFSDTGIGIPSSNLSGIFNPYSRIQKDSEHPSNGLGLLLVKTIVEAHSGKVSLESELQQGTSVTIELSAAPSLGRLDRQSQIPLIPPSEDPTSR